MIFVIIGTQDKPFVRLLNAIEKLDTKEEIIVQAGHTKFENIKNNIRIFDFIDNSYFNELLDKADIIITHGGVGTIMQALNKNKKVIAVSRLSKFNEHQNDHQLEIVNNFTKLGYILDCTNLDLLPETIQSINSFIPNKYKSNNESFKQIIIDYIN